MLSKASPLLISFRLSSAAVSEDESARSSILSILGESFTSGFSPVIMNFIICSLMERYFIFSILIISLLVSGLKRYMYCDASTRYLSAGSSVL